MRELLLKKSILLTIALLCSIFFSGENVFATGCYIAPTSAEGNTWESALMVAVLIPVVESSISDNKNNIFEFIQKNENNNAAPLMNCSNASRNYDYINSTQETFSLLLVAPTIDSVADQIFCAGSTTPITFSGTATSYSWTGGAAIGLADGSGTRIPAFEAINNRDAAVMAEIIVTPFDAGGTTGIPEAFNIIVNPMPSLISSLYSEYCNEEIVPLQNFQGNIPGITFEWNRLTGQGFSQEYIGLPLQGVDFMPAFTAINTGIYPVSAGYSITPKTQNGCVGSPLNYNITVNPTPSLDRVADQKYCSDQLVSGLSFTGNNPNASHYWHRLNGNTIANLPNEGYAQLPSFRTFNNTTEVQTAQYEVTAYFYGNKKCGNAKDTFSITINPIPRMNPILDTTYCAGMRVLKVILGAGYTWAQSGSNIGLDRTSGSDSIPAFITTNRGVESQTAIFTITPKSQDGICIGNDISYRITVNPNATMGDVTSQEVCNNQNTNEIIFGGSSGNNIYSWQNSNPSIGLGANGQGDIPSFRTVNGDSVAAIATITVIPTYMNNGVGCANQAEAKTFTIKVRPDNSAVANLFDTTCCSGTPVHQKIIREHCTWVQHGDNIGLNQLSGNNSIPTFIANNTGTTPLRATFQIMPPAGSCNSQTTSFTITVNPTPSVNTIENQTVCGQTNTTPVFFGGNIASNVVYKWTNTHPEIGLATEGVGNIPAFKAVNNGNTNIAAVIRVTSQYQNGTTACEGGSREFTITVLPADSISPIHIFDTAYCAGTYLPQQIFNKQHSSYRWIQRGDYIGLSQINGVDAIPAFTVENSGNTTLKAYFDITSLSGNCNTDAITFAISVYPNPKAIDIISVAGNDICAGTSATLTARVNENIDRLQWYSDADLKNLITTERTYTTDVLAQNATYYILPVSKNGCIANSSEKAKVAVTVNSLPSFDKLYIQGDTIVEEGGRTSLTASGAAGGRYMWYSDSLTNDLLEEGNAYTTPALYEATNYFVKAQSNAGCFSRETHKATIRIKPNTLELPQALTPNGDGTNDVLIIKGIENYPNSRLQIYSRSWGKVYDKVGYSNQRPFDGYCNLSLTLGHKRVPSDVYFYTLELKDGSNSVFKGFIDVRY